MNNADNDGNISNSKAVRQLDFEDEENKEDQQGEEGKP